MYPEDESILRWRHSEILPDDKNGRMVLSHDRSHFKLDKMNHPSVVRALGALVFSLLLFGVITMCMMLTHVSPCFCFLDSLRLVHYSRVAGSK